MKFTNYLIYRLGSNRANQELCNKMPVAIVAATSRQEACRIAQENLTFYANQTAEAIPESKANATDWDFVCEVAALSDEFFVGQSKCHNSKSSHDLSSYSAIQL